MQKLQIFYFIKASGNSDFALTSPSENYQLKWKPMNNVLPIDVESKDKEFNISHRTFSFWLFGALRC